MQNIRCHRRERGLTFVELVLSIALIGVLAFSVGPMLMNGVKSYMMVAKRKAALSQTRFAMDRMVHDIRLIPDTASIDTWTSSVFQFDIPSEANVNYSLNGTDLERSGSVLADGVNSLTFTYLDSAGNTAVAKADIYRIGVAMVVSAGTGYGTITIQTQVFPREFAEAYEGFE